MSLLDKLRSKPLYLYYDDQGVKKVEFVASHDDKPDNSSLIIPNDEGSQSGDVIPKYFHLAIINAFFEGYLVESFPVDVFTDKFQNVTGEIKPQYVDSAGMTSATNMDNKDFIWIIDNFEVLSFNYQEISDGLDSTYLPLKNAFSNWIDGSLWANSVGQQAAGELNDENLESALKDYIYGIPKFNTFFGDISDEQRQNILRNLVEIERTHSDPTKISGADVFRLDNFERYVAIYLANMINPNYVYSDAAGSSDTESFSPEGGWFGGENVGNLTEINDNNQVILLSGLSVSDLNENVPIEGVLVWKIKDQASTVPEGSVNLVGTEFFHQVPNRPYTGLSSGQVAAIFQKRNYWVAQTQAAPRIQGPLPSGYATDVKNQLFGPSSPLVTWEMLQAIIPPGALVDVNSLEIFSVEAGGMIETTATPADRDRRMTVPAKINMSDLMLNEYMKTAEQEVLSNYANTGDDETYGGFFRSIAYVTAYNILVLLATQEVNKYKAQLWELLWKAIHENEEVPEDFAERIKQELKDKARENPATPLREEVEDEYADIRKNAAAQCALLANIDKLAVLYRDLKERNSDISDHPLHGGGNFYKSRFYSISSSEPTKTLTKLNAGDYTSNLGAFLGATPDMQAYLVPKIKLQKVFVNQQGAVESIDIPFDTYTKKPMSGNTPIDYKTQFQTPGNVFKGGGSGIKSMSFEFDGETPATAEKYVKAELKLFFQDFNSLFEDKITVAHSLDGTFPTTFKYIDLLINPLGGSNSSKMPTTEATERMEFYDPSFYRIKVEIGWDMANPTPDTSAAVYPTQLKNSLDYVNKTLMLCALDHEINVKNDGTVELSISYRGYGDTLLKTNRFNALIPYREQAEISALIANYNSELASGNCTIDQRAEFQATIASLQKSVANQAAARVINTMTRNGLIHRAAISSNAAKEFDRNGAFSVVPELTTTIDGGLRPNATDPRKEFSFFFLGDLLFTILDCQYFDNTGVPVVGAENLKIILTDMNIRQFLPSGEGDPNANTMLIPISSIPIAIEQYKNWFMNEILGTERYNMPVMEFIQRFTNDVCGCFLSEICFTKEEDKSIFFRQGSIIGDKSLDIGGIATQFIGGEINIDEQNVSNVAGEGNNFDAGESLTDLASDLKPITLSSNLNGHEVMEYAVIYVDTPPKHIATGTGISTDNLTNGILHLNIGADRGILKTASWSKQNVQYLREARMFRSQGIGNYAQLATYYNVSLSLFGNFLLTPGMIFYLDPFGIGGQKFGRPNEPGRESGGSGAVNFSRLMGIGGYHLVTGVKVNFTPQKFETTVEGRFLFSGDNNEAGSVSLSRSVIEQSNMTIDNPDAEQQVTDAESCRGVISVAQAALAGGS